MVLLRPLLVASFIGLATSASISSRSGPTVQLDDGTFIGQSSGSINSFLGIPFALPPVGDLRFRLPQPILPYNGSYSATAFGATCIQQNATLVTPPGLEPGALQYLAGFAASFAGLTPDDEDCLTINVIVPANVSADAKLPILATFFGGGFEVGGSSFLNGSTIVDRSIQLKKPIIFVSFNYRVNALGFLGGKEARAAGAGNLGLQDQRLALRWVQKYISAFGGDPSKVTIWGESAGAISVAYQMITNGGDTEGLFRGGFMTSGSPLPSGPIENGQFYFDQLVENTNCTAAEDPLECLRGVPIDVMRNAINSSPNVYSYESLALAWVPREDGAFLKANPQQLVLQGSVAKIPFITGDSDDEGTLFTLSQTNLTTNDDVRGFMNSVYFPKADAADIDELLELYPEDPAEGSPFDTGDANQLTPQFKRLAAIQGDLVFQAPRRFFLDHCVDKQAIFFYLNKRQKSVPDLGAAHVSDRSNFYGPGDLTDYLIRFVVTLDPNGDSAFNWPRYSTNSREALTLLDGDEPITVTKDDYRKKAIAFMSELSLKEPI